jgi:hypothetical protein
MCGSVADADPDGEVHGRADRDDGDSDGERDDPSITSSSPRSWPQAGSETMVERPVPLGRDGEAPVQALRPLTTACWEVWSSTETRRRREDSNLRESFTPLTA